jgi:hypothetical protein
MFPVRLPTIPDVKEAIKSIHFYEGIIFGATVAIGATWYFFSVQNAELITQQVSQVINLKNQEIEDLQNKLDIQELSFEKEKAIELKELEQEKELELKELEQEKEFEIYEVNQEFYQDKYDLLDLQLLDANFNVEWTIDAIDKLIEANADEEAIKLQKELLDKYLHRVESVENKIQTLQVPNKAFKRN